MSRHPIKGWTSVVLATRNHGKLREFRALLEPAAWHILGLSDIPLLGDLEESGGTFAENARLKALAYSQETDFAVLADDSGLEVFALGGRPGIYSARYAGPGASDDERNRKLLDELEASGGERSARFVCALALARRGELLLEVEGECRGTIAREPRGSNGFGYDPVFLFPELGRTYAELTDAQKNRHSHRASAVRSLLERLGKVR
jgi:XTP/dITP diphosphohydrolase